MWKPLLVLCLTAVCAAQSDGRKNINTFGEDQFSKLSSEGRRGLNMTIDAFKYGTVKLFFSDNPEPDMLSQKIDSKDMIRHISTVGYSILKININRSPNITDKLPGGLRKTFALEVPHSVELILNNKDKTITLFEERDKVDPIKSIALENNYLQYVFFFKIDHEGHDHPTDAFEIKLWFLKFDIEKVKTPLVIIFWLLFASFIHFLFHGMPEDVRHFMPESCLLLFSGIFLGFALVYTKLLDVPALSPHIFFTYMLPPIIFQAGYHIPNRAFFDNFFTILLFACMGTILNAFIIGGGMYLGGCMTGAYPMGLLAAFLYGSIASAIDPVAVISVFEELHVNVFLYIIVFGESLLNDGVCVVLYQLFENYIVVGIDNLAWDVAVGVLGFLYIALGGMVLGTVWGFFSSFLISFTNGIKPLEVLIVYCLAYLSYIIAEILNVSAILSLTFCGIAMKNYVEELITCESRITLKVSMRMLANISEAIIFILLGLELFNKDIDWNFPFMGLTILVCLVVRVLVTILLSNFVNQYRMKKITWVDQFILSYGGLRGAVAVALVLVIDSAQIPSKNLMISGIIGLVLFTIVLQGLSIGFVVKYLKVMLDKDEPLSENVRIHMKMADHFMSGLEEIIGNSTGNNHLRQKFKHLNNTILRKAIIRNDKANNEPKILETFSKLNMSDAMRLAMKNDSELSKETNAALLEIYGSLNCVPCIKSSPEEEPPRDSFTFAAHPSKPEAIWKIHGEYRDDYKVWQANHAGRGGSCCQQRETTLIDFFHKNEKRRSTRLEKSQREFADSLGIKAKSRSCPKSDPSLSLPDQTSSCDQRKKSVMETFRQQQTKRTIKSRKEFAVRLMKNKDEENDQDQDSHQVTINIPNQNQTHL